MSNLSLIQENTTIIIVINYSNQKTGNVSQVNNQEREAARIFRIRPEKKKVNKTKNDLSKPS